MKLLHLAQRGVSTGQLLTLAIKYPGYVANFLRRRLRLGSAYRSSKVTSVDTVLFELTYRCNLKCPSCWFYGTNGLVRNGTTPLEELNTAEVKQVLLKLKDAYPLVNFTGGEPFLRKDFLEIVRYCRKIGLPVSVNTNGVLINDFGIEDVLDAGFVSINISLDGVGDVHDKSRGVKCFDKVAENIILLTKSRKGKLPILKIGLTVNNFNFSHIPEVCDFANQVGVDVFQVQHQWFLGDKDVQEHNSRFSTIFGQDCPLLSGYVSDAHGHIDTEELIRQIDIIKAGTTPMRVEVFPDLGADEIRRYYSDEYYPKIRCGNPWHSITIMPDGNVAPCLGFVVGNLKDHDLMTILNGNKFVDFRERLLKAGHWRGCIRCCGYYSYPII